VVTQCLRRDCDVPLVVGSFHCFANVSGKALAAGFFALCRITGGYRHSAHFQKTPLRVRCFEDVTISQRPWFSQLSADLRVCLVIVNESLVLGIPPQRTSQLVADVAEFADSA